MTDTGMNVANEMRLVAESFIGDRDYEFGGKLNEWADRIETWQAALQAGAGGGELVKIGELIRTQNNRITEQPVFIVQQKRIIGGMDSEYAEKFQWLDKDSQEVDDDLAAELEAEYEETYDEREGYRRIGYCEIWEFVQACFTEQGCKDYIARDGHNLREPRIYASGSYRNHEWQTVRKYLIDNAQDTERK